ncbi:MAG: sulfotransferase, partial [Verrucomicrobiota bacterium]
MKEKAVWDLERALQEQPPLMHPLGGADIDTFFAHLRGEHHFSPRSRFQRWFSWFAVITRLPISGLEKIFYERTLRDEKLKEPPVFIVGHWRSGTTLLHQILSLDPRFRFLDFGQMATPHEFLGPIHQFYRSLVGRALPEDRGYDRVKLSLDAPQEEEIALASFNRLSYYGAYYFPTEMMRHFREAVLFE